MNAGTLNIELMADLARLSRDLNAGKGMLGNFARDAERMMTNAARTIGGAFLAIIGAISFDAIVKAAHEGEKAALRLDAVIRATGTSAGYSREQLDAMAESIHRATQFDDDAARTAIAHILRFGNVAGEQLERTLKASADLAAFMGTDLVSATDTVAKAMAAPAQGVERLQRTIGYLDEAQIKAIKTMAEMGDTVGAQNQLLTILEGRLGGVAEAMNTGYTKAIESAKKETQEFWEAVGRSVPVQEATQSFLGFVADSFRDLKQIVEGGDWVEKTLRLFAFIGGWRGVGNPTSGSAGAPSNSAAAEQEAARIKKVMEGIDEQDAKLTAIALARQKKAFEEAERARKAAAEKAQDARYDHAQAEQQANDMFATDYVEAWKWADFYRNAEAKAAQEERDQLARQSLEIQRESIRLWSQVADVAGDFFRDLVINGKSAFDNLKKWTKQLLADMIAVFAKRWILNMAANGSAGSAGGAAGNAIISAAGDGIAGTALSFAGSAAATWAMGTAGAGALGATAGGAFAQGAMGVGSGVWASGSAGAMGSSLSGVYSALAAIPVWGWIAMAVIAIGAWIANSKAGGDKVGGSFFSGGAVPGTDNGRFFTPSQGDSGMQQLVLATSAGYEDAMRRLGGDPAKFNFGLGFDHDPRGSARSRVSSLLTDANGNRIYGVNDREMDDKEVEGALGLESQRLLVAALQNSDLHDALDKLFDGIDVSTATSEQLSAILQHAMVIKNIIDVLAIWDTDLTVESIQMMVREGETLGQTFQSVAQSMATYYQLFYTEEENLARNTEIMRKQFEAAGLTMPKTREEFRALVDSLDLTTESGARLFRWLMEISGAFADIVPAADVVVDAVDDVADTFRDAGQVLEQTASGIRGWDEVFRRWYEGKGARESLAQSLDRSLLGKNSPLDPMQQLAEAQRQYDEVLKLAQGGDIAAIGKLGGARDSLVDIARSIFGSSSPFIEIFNRTFEEAAKIAEVASLNERMLAASLNQLQYQAQIADTLLDVRGLLQRIADEGPRQPVSADRWESR